MREQHAVDEDCKNNVPHSERHYCLIVVDYCMNTEVPHLGAEQPGMTYYMQKYNGYIFGVVNSAHEYELEDDATSVEDRTNVEDHTDVEDEQEHVSHFMNAYLYEEWEGGKDSNHVHNDDFTYEDTVD